MKGTKRTKGTQGAVLLAVVVALAGVWGAWGAPSFVRAWGDGTTYDGATDLHIFNVPTITEVGASNTLIVGIRVSERTETLVTATNVHWRYNKHQNSTVGGQHNMDLWSGYVTNGGSVNVTITFTEGDVRRAMYVFFLEYSGLADADPVSTAGATTNYTATAIAGDVTVTNDDSLIICAAATEGDVACDAGDWAAGAGWTFRRNPNFTSGTDQKLGAVERIASAGVYSAYISFSGNASDIWTASAVVYPAAADGGTGPTITAGPESVTVHAGSNAVFSVTATGTAPLAYQWHWYSTNVTGATASSWTIAPGIGDDGSEVACGVTNSYGGVLSGDAILTVTNGTAPTITAGPENTAALVGTTATFTVTASGTPPLSYQWQWYSTNVAGATGSSWTTPALAIGDNGSVVLCGVTNGYGGLESDGATLSVTNAPVAAPAVAQRVYILR